MIIRAKISTNNAISFFNLKPNIGTLCVLLRCTPEQLYNITQNPNYTIFNIPKKKGGHREIIAPNSELKQMQYFLNQWLQKKYLCIDNKAAFGFIRSSHKNRKDITANASMHLKKPFILNCDIKDYFPSIKIEAVRDIFMDEPFNFKSNLASALALLCTYNNRLPAGAPSSPILSNFYCLKMDYELLSFAKYYNLTYTRYADDLSFSSETKINTELVDKIKTILSGYGFSLNEKKTRFTCQHQAQTVTGIKVNEKLNLNRNYLKKIRAIIHNASRLGIENVMINYTGKKPHTVSPEYFINSINGHLAHIGNVRGKDDAFYHDLKTKWENCLAEFKPTLKINK
jgi:RNA-directed DNA polymerase